MKLALRMIRYEIGPWGLLILLFATTLAGKNSYHVWYTNIFIVFCYLFIVFQVQKTNHRLLLQMRYLPNYGQQFRTIALIFSAAILCYISFIFALADAAKDGSSFLYLAQFFACSFTMIYFFLDNSMKNFLLCIFVTACLFFQPSPLSVLAVLAAFLPFSNFWNTIGKTRQVEQRLTSFTVHGSTAGILQQDEFVRQFIQLKYKRLDAVRSSLLWFFAALALPFLYAAQAIVQHQDAAIFQFFVFMQCLVLTGGYFYLLLISTDLTDLLEDKGRLSEFYFQLRQSGYVALLVPAACLLVLMVGFVDGNLQPVQPALSLASGLAFLDSAMLMLAVSPIRRRLIPLWLLAGIVLMLCEPYQQAILVLPIAIGTRLVFSDAFRKWSVYAQTK